MGFYLSNITETPALLFNPCLNFKNGSELRPYNLNSNEFLEKSIIFSNQVNIDIKSTIKYLNSLGYSYQIEVLENSEQNISIDIFEKYFDIFYKKYQQVVKSLNETSKNLGPTKFASKIISPRLSHFSSQTTRLP